jgi:hypothetical protein
MGARRVNHGLKVCGGSVFNSMTQYFGRWMWYDVTRCEYEQLKYSVYSLNFIMIVLLIGVLAWGSRQKRISGGLVPEGRRITGVLFLGLCGWVFQYILHLSTFQRGVECQFPQDVSGNFFAKYGTPTFSCGVSLAFFFAGSYLLQLKGRLHVDLGKPTSQGVQLTTFSNLLGNQPARIFYTLAELVNLWFQWSAPNGRPAVWFDSLGNCVAHLTFGLGLLRELNRERREFVGMASGVSMLFYGAVQLTSLKNELFFDGYVLAALLKFALLLTILSFGTMIRQTSLTRREGRREERGDLVELLIALNSTLSHDLTKPLEPLDPLVELLANKASINPDLTRKVRDALKTAENFFNDWPEGLNPKRISVRALVTTRKFSPKLTTSDDLYEAHVPPLFLEWALDRLRENATKAGARELTITLDRAMNKRKESVVVVRVENDGLPIQPDANLWEKPHGTWVARHLLDLVGGTLELESTGAQATIFRIELPAAGIVAEPVQAAKAMSSGVTR